MIFHEAPAVNIDKSFANVGVYETPYFTGGTFVGRGLLVIKFKKIVYEADTIPIVFKDISPVHAAVECVINLH